MLYTVNCKKVITLMTSATQLPSTSQCHSYTQWSTSYHNLHAAVDPLQSSRL